MFRLYPRLTGDTHLQATPLSAFADEVLARLGDHVRAEGQVLAGLVEVVPHDRVAELAADLAAATATAPTRPHPHTPHTAAARLVSRLDALVDRVRDVLDNRVSSTGRAPVPARPLGRWGGYLMGAGPRTDSDRS